ncbi:hypothetical protein HZA86_05205 [Candidatus Uhrbacteria bacterium]|nr:hypothetical protein [Candidatus Uhrbacteria bacterium]
MLNEEFKKVREEIKSAKDDTLTALDEQSVILRRLDQERTFALEKVKKSEEEGRQIKLKLAIA